MAFTLNKNDATTLVIPGLKDLAGNFVDEPTLASGDVQISKDGGAFANLGTLPTTVSGTPLLNITLTADETDADTLIIQFEDQTSPSEWVRAFVSIRTRNYVKTISSTGTEVSSILADTNELQGNQGDWATATGFATATSLATVQSNTTQILEDTGTTLPGTLSAILEDTGTALPATLSGLLTNIGVIDGIVDDILVDTSTTIPGTLLGINAAVGVVDGIVDAILVDTDELQSNQGDWVTATGFATATALSTVQADITSILADTGSTLDGKLDTIILGVDVKGWTGTALEELGDYVPSGETANSYWAAWNSSGGGGDATLANQQSMLTFLNTNPIKVVDTNEEVSNYMEVIRGMTYDDVALKKKRIPIDGTVHDLTNFTEVKTCTIRETSDDSVAATITDIEIENGGTASQEIAIAFAANTFGTTLPLGQAYKFDVVLEDSDGRKFPAANGTFNLKENQTR